MCLHAILTRLPVRQTHSYSKTENLRPGDERLHRFEYLLAEPPAAGKHAEDALLLQRTHNIVEFVECFSQIGLQARTVGFPVKIKTKPCLWIMQRSRLAVDAVTNDRHRRSPAAFDSPPNGTVSGTKQALADTTDDEDIDNDGQQKFDRMADYDERTPRESGDIGELPEAPDRQPMRAKLREIIVSHYRSRGRLVESDAPMVSDAPPSAPSLSPAATSKASMKSNIKRIIRAEQIREMVEQMATIDLNRACDLVRMTTKECLHKLIDDQDEHEAA